MIGSSLFIRMPRRTPSALASSGSSRAWVVSFCSQKGGVGKSTLACAFASYVARAGAQVKLIDFDPQQASAWEWNETRRGLGHSPALDVAEAATSDDVMGLLTGAAVIIVDGPGRASKATLELAKVSHLVVQPTGGSRNDILPAERVFRELIEAGIPRQRLTFALCRIDSDAEEKGTRAYLESLDYAVLPGCLPSRSGYKVAQNAGFSVLETNYPSLNRKAAELVGALAERMFAIHEMRTHIEFTPDQPDNTRMQKAG